MPVKIIDGGDGPMLALRGRIVTMNKRRSVIKDGIIYINKGCIVSVQKATNAPPDGFADVRILETNGTIYPGLIELHNHLSYNILPLWQVPKKYTNRNQWGGTAEYRKLISGPMNILGRTPGYVEAIVRYVECKCLMAGVTTSQGIALFSNNGIQKYYRGIVRNVETTEEAELPEAVDKISDVESKSVQAFFQRLKRSSCLLLHLSEGIDSQAHKHFEALKIADDEWALTDALAGIHCVALKNRDFKIMKEKGASMVWSPLSNLLLYGKTANIRSAHENGILIGIGSDWSPSGSKNLFGELKVAKIISDQTGIFSDSDILAMATTNAAKILEWEKVLGSIEINKRADLMVINDLSGDPYKTFFEKSEAAISLVIINGIPRYGYKALMNNLGRGFENIKVGGIPYLLNLKQDTADPVVGKLKLKNATATLSNGLENIVELAKQLEKPTTVPKTIALSQKTNWFLVLDHNDIDSQFQRTRFTPKKKTSVKERKKISRPIALSEIVSKMKLDALTVADDETFFNELKKQKNLPAYIKNKLKSFYN